MKFCNTTHTQLQPNSFKIWCLRLQNCNWTKDEHKLKSQTSRNQQTHRCFPPNSQVQDKTHCPPQIQTSARVTRHGWPSHGPSCTGTTWSWMYYVLFTCACSKFSTEYSVILPGDTLNRPITDITINHKDLIDSNPPDQDKPLYHVARTHDYLKADLVIRLYNVQLSALFVTIISITKRL